MPDYAVAMGFSARDLGIMEQYDKMARGAEEYGDRASRAFNKVNDHSSQALRNVTKHGYNFGAIVKGIIAADLIRGGVNQVKDGLGEVIHQFVEFDHEMTQAMVRFEDVGPKAANFKDVVKSTGKEIRQLALTSRFSFTDLAKAYAQVGRSKMFGHEEGVQALVPLMNLNIDAQGDFEESTKSLMDTMGAWALNTLPVKDRLKGLYDLTDLFAQAQNEAQVQVADLAETMKTVGPLARGMGYEIKDMTAMMLLLGKAGIKGHEAGTSLKNIFAHMADPTTRAKFANFGVPIEDKDTHAPRKLSAIMHDLNKQFGNVTPIQRMSILFEGFGLRAIAGTSDIIRQLGDLKDIEARLKEIEGVGAKNAGRINADMSTMLIRMKNSLIEKGMQLLDKYGERFLSWLDRMFVAINKFDIDPVVNALDTLGTVLGLVYSIVKPFVPMLPYLVLGFYGWKASMAAWNWMTFANGILMTVGSGGQLLTLTGLLTAAWVRLNAVMLANPIGLIALAGLGIYSTSKSLHGFRRAEDNPVSQMSQSLFGYKLSTQPTEADIAKADRERYPAPNSGSSSKVVGRYQLDIMSAPTGSTFSGASSGGAPSIHANMLGENR